MNLKNFDEEYQKAVDEYQKALPECPPAGSKANIADLLKPDPNDNTAYYMCMDGIPHRFMCPDGLVYHHDLRRCDYPNE